MGSLTVCKPAGFSISAMSFAMLLNFFFVVPICLQTMP